MNSLSPDIAVETSDPNEHTDFDDALVAEQKPHSAAISQHIAMRNRISFDYFYSMQFAIYSAHLLESRQ